MWEHCNGIKNNTITSQKQWELNEIGILLQEQQAIGIIGMRQKDIHFIHMIDATLWQPLHIQRRWLEYIHLARAAFIVDTEQQEAQLAAPQARFQAFFQGRHTATDPAQSFWAHPMET